MRRALRAFSTVMIVAGTLLLLDAGLTVVWQEPLSALYSRITQDQLGGELDDLAQSQPTGIEARALGALEGDARRIAFLSRALRRQAESGEAVARVRIPSIGVDKVVVEGTTTAALRKGPGFFEDNPLPGAPGTVAIAGHRTTYGAPFNEIDELERGDTVRVEMPYGVFTYEVERRQIVAPTEVSVVRRVSFDRLVLSACHPLYSAAQRIVVFARLTDVQPRGAALAAPV
jgi:sortase A